MSDSKRGPMAATMPMNPTPEEAVRIAEVYKRAFKPNPYVDHVTADLLCVMAAKGETVLEDARCPTCRPVERQGYDDLVEQTNLESLGFALQVMTAAHGPGQCVSVADLQSALSGCREPHKHTVCALEAVAEVRDLLAAAKAQGKGSDRD